MSAPICRFCGSSLRHTFVDLGMSPLSNGFRRADQLGEMEPYYPLHARVCERCFLVQLEEFSPPEEIFTDYAYFSSFSESWLHHAEEYANQVTRRLFLGGQSLVVEIASNDGYLLQYFQAKGVPVLGVEPARNVALAAEQKGIKTVQKFFSTRTACELGEEGLSADLIIANNVLAHVPDLEDFVTGLKLLLKSNGVLTVEFPHLLRLIEARQFDTIYHEHLSYFSFCTAQEIFSKHGLTVFDVEELTTHGGSLRLYICHEENASRPICPSVARLKTSEIAAGLRDLAIYSSFEERVRETKRALLEFMIAAKRNCKTVAGYGAPAKGNTLLNYCGIGKDFIDYTVDRNPHKQNLFLPGTHIPIHDPGMIWQTRPDYVLILPWNLREEIMETLAGIREWGASFVVPIPSVEVIP